MKLGIVGWRGMVGQVLMERMLQEGDLNHFETTFFSTSNAGGTHPYTSVKSNDPILRDAHNTDELKKWTSFSHARVEIIPNQSLRNCDLRALKVIGSTLLLPFVWTMKVLSFSIQ